MFRAWNKSPKGKQGYELMMGYSDSIMGEYTKYPEIIYDGVHRPGHGGYTASPDGTEMWLVAHCWDATRTNWDYRWLMMEKWGGFKVNGDPHTVYENFEAQPGPSREVINGNIASGGKPVNCSQKKSIITGMS